MQSSETNQEGSLSIGGGNTAITAIRRNQETTCNLRDTICFEQAYIYLGLNNELKTIQTTRYIVELAATLFPRIWARDPYLASNRPSTLSIPAPPT